MAHKSNQKEEETERDWTFERGSLWMRCVCVTLSLLATPPNMWGARTQADSCSGLDLKVRGQKW